MEIIPLLLLVLICLALLFGYPVAFTLSGVSILFALICIPFGIFDESILKSIPLRIFGIMNNVTLLAVPLFIFMGTVLERSGIAAKMLENMALAFKNIRGGLSISIIAVGALLAASTGIVGATVVTMGLMSLPVLIQQGYKKDFSSGLGAFWFHVSLLVRCAGSGNQNRNQRINLKQDTRLVNTARSRLSGTPSL